MGIRVLFVCTANAARSQMAEALLRSIGGDRFEVFSAGTQPAERVHPKTARVLERIGIRTTGYVPRSIEALRGETLDFVITLSDEAREACQLRPLRATQVIHWNITDPQAGSPTELAFIEAMKELRRRVELFATVAATQATGPT